MRRQRPRIVGRAGPPGPGLPQRRDGDRADIVLEYGRHGADQAAGVRGGLLQHLDCLVDGRGLGLEGAVERLLLAHESLSALAGSDAARARRVADLLDRALACVHYDGAQPSPVCGSGRLLDEAWAESTTVERDRLRFTTKSRIRATEGATQLRLVGLDATLALLPLHGGRPSASLTNAIRDSMRFFYGREGVPPPATLNSSQLVSVAGAAPGAI